MGTGSENKKQSRLRKKNQKAKRKDQRKSEKRNSLAVKYRYPKFVLDEHPLAAPEFVAAVQKAIETVDFSDKKFFSNWHREKYQILSGEGAEKAQQSVVRDGDSNAALLDQLGNPEASYLLAPGEAIYAAIPEESKKRLLPFNDMQVSPEGQSFRVKFFQLETDVLDGQRVYFSRHRPTVSIDGKKRIVAFTNHAIERVRERLNPRWMNYAAAGDVHAYFSHCKHFELCLLHSNREAVTFYDRIMVGFAKYSVYVNEVLGTTSHNPKKGLLYYRLGYCPLAISEDFVIAKTFLYPGYESTPEYNLILNSNLTRAEKNRLIALSDNNNSDEVVLAGNTEVIKWFHDHGVPQVIQTKKKFFDYD